MPALLSVKLEPLIESEINTTLAAATEVCRPAMNRVIADAEKAVLSLKADLAQVTDKALHQSLLDLR